MLTTGLQEMALHKIKDFDPDYKNHFGEGDLKGLDVYVGDEKIGSVEDVLVDDDGQFRYLVINTGLWILGKKVLLPIGRARIEQEAHKVYAQDLTKAQVEALPEFTNDLTVDYDHEEQVRGVYRTGMPQDVSSIDPSATTATLSDRNTYTYDKEPDLYRLNDTHHATFKLYEERLVSSKSRQKSGEAVISKHIETETATASVPIDKERVVIERMPATGKTAVAPGEATFQPGEVSRVEVYEEVPEFHKEAFVREEVRVNKVVETETLKTQEQLRREELDIDIEGHPVVENKI
jgi:uncharacterized protein (TIGR02271 family)